MQCVLSKLSSLLETIHNMTEVQSRFLQKKDGFLDREKIILCNKCQPFAFSHYHIIIRLYVTLGNTVTGLDELARLDSYDVLPFCFQEYADRETRVRKGGSERESEKEKIFNQSITAAAQHTFFALTGQEVHVCVHTKASLI